MDDLLNTDWNAEAPAAKQQNASRPAFGMPMSIPSVAASSSRASPAPSPFANNLPAFKAPSKALSPANDIFANLVSTNANKNQGNLSLLERQKQLLQEKSRQEQEQHQTYALQYGNEATFWDNLGSGKGTPQPVAHHAAPPAQDDEDDLLAAFNSAAPVDKSSHFPIPAASTVASGRNTPAVANSTNSATLLADDDDDDPFGLGAAPQRKASPYQPPPAINNSNDDDDILGDLGKPVTAKPARPEPVDEAFAVNDRSSPPPSDPLDRPIAELVDMGFPADRSRVALQETAGDVQSAVGWLLNQAHQESRERTQARGSARASPVPQARDESRRGRGPSDDAVPPWMRQESRPSSHQRKQDNGTPNSEKDVAAYAQEFGTSFLKSAGSLWKTGQKNLKKAVADLQQPEADPNTPKWMRDASADRAAPRPGRSSTARAPPTTQTAEELTNEAMLLEARDERQRPAKSRTPEVRDPVPRPESRVRSPAQDLPVRTQPQPPFAQQAPPQQPQRLNAKVNRSEVEEESSQAYVSSARRRRPATKPEPQPEPEVDPFSPAPTQPPPKPASTRTTPAPRPAASKASKPVPQPSRHKAPPRKIPAISPSALSTSSNHRRAGTEAFKRGDFDAAHNSYSAALTPLPPNHPLIIIVLSNRALTAIKTGDPKAAIVDADRALELIGVGKGENEKIDLGSGEGEKNIKEFYGKALMRKAEALENMEKWSDAGAVWKDAIAAGVGGVVSLRARERCEKAASGGVTSASRPAPSNPTPMVSKTPAGKLTQPKRPAIPQAQSQEAVRKLREANAAADKADDEKFALSDQVEAKVTAWKGGKSDNLRALLGSLDTVLWPEAGWKKVNMSDLIMPNKVKIVYMKAIAKVHPDKIPQTATTEQKMISGSVFSTLNEAWDKFKKDNGL